MPKPHQWRLLKVTTHAGNEVYNVWQCALCSARRTEEASCKPAAFALGDSGCSGSAESEVERAQTKSRDFRDRLCAAMQGRSWSPTLTLVDFMALLEFVEVELTQWLIDHGSSTGA